MFFFLKFHKALDWNVTHVCSQVKDLQMASNGHYSSSRCAQSFELIVLEPLAQVSDARSAAPASGRFTVCDVGAPACRPFLNGGQCQENLALCVRGTTLKKVLFSTRLRAGETIKPFFMSLSVFRLPLMA